MEYTLEDKIVHHFNTKYKEYEKYTLYVCVLKCLISNFKFITFNIGKSKSDGSLSRSKLTGIYKD